MSNSKQTSNRSKIRAGQTYYRVVNIMGDWRMETIRPNGVKFAKHKLSRTVGHISANDCTVGVYNSLNFDPKNVFYGQSAEQLAENNFVKKVSEPERNVTFNSTAFIRKPKSRIEWLLVATGREEISPNGERFYSVICSSRESRLSYAERQNESKYVEQGFIRGGKTNVFGDFQPAYGVFCSKRDAQRFLKEILDGQHSQLLVKVEDDNNWESCMDDSYSDDDYNRYTYY